MKVLLLLIFLSPIISFSQQLFLPLNHNVNIDINKQVNYLNNNVHTSFKPVLSSYLNNYFDSDSIIYDYQRDSIFLSKKKHTWIWRKLRTEDLILIDTADFFLSINPMFNLEYGRNTINDSLLSVNTRGIAVKGNIGKTLSFYSDFYENQAFFPDYVHQYINEHAVIPGQGRNRGFKGNGHDYAYASGYLSFTPKKYLNFRIGHGKNFIGEGYRSLLLSDFSFNYPFVRTTITLNKFQYTSMFTAHQEIKSADSRLLAYQRKHGSFNYLSWLINKRIQIGLFEGIIWKTTYSNSNNNFDINYFNPAIMVRPLQYGLSDENNVVLGLNAEIKIINSIQLYGQYMLDDVINDYTGEKNGYQIGIKFFEIFKLKNLYLQAEYNSVSPYTYGHVDHFQNYSNANEPLAHPLGANFKEVIGIMHYKINDFFIDFKYIKSNINTSLNNYHCGSNIFLSDTLACELIQTNDIKYLKSTLTYISLRLGFLINPRNNMHLFAGFVNRKFINNSITTETNYIFLGIRASLNNHYYDF